MKRPSVMIRETPRAQIEIEALVEVADLCRPYTMLIHLLEYGAAPSRVIPATRPVSQFDNLAIVICACQFIGSGQPGDAGAQDDD
jgi:hypothetical protein